MPQDSSGPIRNVGMEYCMNMSRCVAPVNGHIISREAGMGLSSNDRLSRGIRLTIRRTNTMKSSRNTLPLLRRMTSSLSSISPSGSESTSTPSTSANNQDTTRFSNIEIGTSTHIRVAEEVETAKRCFHESLPSTLLAEICHQGRHAVAPFEWDECVLGSKIGEGEFSHVFEVKSFRLGGSSFEPDLGTDESKQRLAMKRSEKCPKTKASRYALKLVKPGQIETPEETMQYVEAAGGLALEAEFLSSLSHPNLMKLRGIAHSGPTGMALIMDRLVETLEYRLVRWRRQPKSKSAGMSSLRRSISRSSSFVPSAKQVEKGDAIETRLKIADQIAAALSYLHSHNVLYRDLKPCNIGFDGDLSDDTILVILWLAYLFLLGTIWFVYAVQGNAVLFDLGLARVICPEVGDPNTETYEMSGAGSPRYMAPECLSGEPYNMKADAYSFAVIVWEILSGRIPYAFARRKHHLVTYVVEEHGRPTIDPCWPAAIQCMLKRGFAPEMAKRPKMECMHKTIHQVLLSMEDGK